MKSLRMQNGRRRSQWVVVPLTWLLYVTSPADAELFCVDPRTRYSTTAWPECPADDQHYYESIRQCCGPNPSGAPGERRFERIPRLGEKGSIPRNCYRPLEPARTAASPTCESRARLVEELGLCCIGPPEFIPGGSPLIVNSFDQLATTRPSIGGRLGDDPPDRLTGGSGIAELQPRSGFSGALGGRHFRRDIIKNIPPYYSFTNRALAPAAVNAALDEVVPGLFCRTGPIVGGVQNCPETHPYNAVYNRCCGTQRVVFDPVFATARRLDASGRSCVDLSVPGRPSECPQKAYLCLDPLYFDVMTEQCPATCGRCGFPLVGAAVPGVSAAAPRPPINNYLNYYGALSPSNFGATLIGGTVPVGGGVCADRAVPGRSSDCPHNFALCFVPFYASLMAIQCPATCGLCPFPTGVAATTTTPSPISNLARLVSLGKVGGGVGPLRDPLSNLTALVGRGNIQSGQRFPSAYGLVGRQPTVPGCVDNVRADAPISECPSNAAKCFLPEWQAFMLSECAYTCDRNGCRTGRRPSVIPKLNVSGGTAPTGGTIPNLNPAGSSITSPTRSNISINTGNDPSLPAGLILPPSTTLSTTGPPTII